jgi:hypothetical protein
MSSPRVDERAVPRELSQAWRADRASLAEVRRSYARFVEKQRSPRRPVRFALWVVIGTLLGVGLAQAATHAPWRWLGPGANVTLSPQRFTPAEEAPPTRRAAVESPAALASHGAVVASEPDVPSVPPPAAPLRGAAVASAAPVVEMTPIQAQWQRASLALRAGDFANAHQALLEIERSAPGGERDAARLARAQLLSSHGRAAEATSLLLALEQAAQSQLVRRKARELLGRDSESNEPDRSAPAAEDTQ